MITELILVAAIPGAIYVTRTVMRRRLAADYDRLADYADELDHKAAMLEARHDEDVQWAWQLDDWRDKLCAYADDLRQWEQELRHRFDEDTHADDNGHDPQHDGGEDESEPTARQRFGELPLSAQRHMAVVNQIDAVAAHYVSSSETGIDAEMARILAGVDMNRDLVALLERKEALRTPTSELPPVKKRGDDEMPVPTPPTKPAVVKLPSKRKASKHAVAAGKAA